MALSQMAATPELRFASGGGQAYPASFCKSEKVDQSAFRAYPAQEEYSDEASYQKAWGEYYKAMKAQTVDLVLPVPIGFAYRRPAELELNPRDGPKKRQLLFANHLEMQSIVRSGQPLEQPRDGMVKDTPWYGRLVAKRPAPYLFKTFEEYKTAMRKWFEMALSDADLISHPAEIGALWKVPLHSEDESRQVAWHPPEAFASEEKTVWKEPKNWDGIKEALDKLAKREAKPENTKWIDVPEDLASSETLLEMRCEKRFAMKRCSDFIDYRPTDIEESMKKFVFRSIEEIWQESRTDPDAFKMARYSLVVAVCQLFDSEHPMSALFRDIELWHKLADMMNEQLMAPETVYRYDSTYLALVPVSPQSKHERDITLELYRRLLGMNYCSIGKKYYEESDHTHLPGYALFDRQAKAERETCTGILVSNTAQVIAKFLKMAWQTFPHVGRELVNLLKMMCTYWPDLGDFLSNFDLVGFLRAMAFTEETFLVDFVKCALNFPTSCSAVAHTFIKHANRMTMRDLSDWPDSMIHAFIAVLAYKPDKGNETPNRHKKARRISMLIHPSNVPKSDVAVKPEDAVQSSFVATLVQNVSDSDVRYCQILHAVCHYVSKHKTMAQADVNMVLGSFLGRLNALTDRFVLNKMLQALRYLVSMPAATRFVRDFTGEFNILFTMLHKYFHEPGYCDVLAELFKILGILVASHEKFKAKTFEQYGSLLRSVVEKAPATLCVSVRDFLARIAKCERTFQALCDKIHGLEKMFPNIIDHLDKMIVRLRTSINNDGLDLPAKYFILWDTRNALVKLSESKKKR